MPGQACIHCSKECKSSDSKPFPGSKSKDRIHIRCHIKRSVANKQQQTGNSEAGERKVGPIQSQPTRATPNLDASASSLIDLRKEDEDRIRAETNARRLTKLMVTQEEQAKKDRKDASFFFDMKAGIAKPHEKRQFLHHRNICEIAPRFNDHGHQEEAVGRAYDHSGKDLNTLGDDSDEEAREEPSKSRSNRQATFKSDESPDRQGATAGKRKLKLDDDDRQEAPGKVKKTIAGVKVDETNPCWFCLSSPKVEKHLIVAIGDHCYLTLAKGGLTDEHLLLIPIEHIQSVHHPANSDELRGELEAFKQSLVRFFSSRSMAVVFFERNFRSVHWQIQVIPLKESSSSDLADKIKLISKAHFGNSNYIDIPSDCSISDMVPPSAPYLYWQIEPHGRRFVCQIELKNSFFPVQLPRIVLADKQIMDCRERIDWRRCTKSHEEYVELAKQVKEQYQDYDITC